MSFVGTLLDPPACSINNGLDININFGDQIAINNINGINYRKEIVYKISCSESEVVSQMTMTIKGTPASFNNDILKTDKENLGIKIIQDGAILAPNESIAIDPVQPPKLEAVLLKNPSGNLTVGRFLAGATIEIEYQ